MRRIFIIIMLLSMINVFNLVKAENQFKLQVDNSIKDVSLLRYEIIDFNKSKSDNTYHIKANTPKEFTSFAIAWSADVETCPRDFKISYSVHKPNYGWTKSMHTKAYYSPHENKAELYYTNLLFGKDELLHDSIKFSIHNSDGIDINTAYLVLMDVSKTVEIDRQPNTIKIKGTSCPEIPPMITRSEWCQASNCLEPSFTPIEINPTHIVMHHGASPLSYSDSYAVVRSYWNYHVNELGWFDIGYNYLFDKYGNFFQGRHNPQLPYVDIRAAHAGAANSGSIGINYLGHSDYVQPTEIQNQTCSQFMAWWFYNKGIDPAGEGELFCQDEVTRTLPRICGHRDVNPGGTVCPGNTLYNQLDELISLTSKIIEDCLTTVKTVFEDKQIIAFPNPLIQGNTLNINFDNFQSEDKQIIVLNTAKQIVKKKQTNNSEVKINLDFKKGTYFVKIISENNVVTKKIIVI